MDTPVFLVIEPSADARPWFPCEVGWADATHHGEYLVIDARGFEQWAGIDATYYAFHSILPEALDTFGTKPIAAGQLAAASLRGKSVYSLRPERDTELLDILFADTINVTGIVTVLGVESLLTANLRSKGYEPRESSEILSTLERELRPLTLRSQDVHELHALVDLWAATVAVASAPN
jgi:hypothetical protein